MTHRLNYGALVEFRCAINFGTVHANFRDVSLIDTKLSIEISLHRHHTRHGSSQHHPKSNSENTMMVTDKF